MCCVIYPLTSNSAFVSKTGPITSNTYATNETLLVRADGGTLVKQDPRVRAAPMWTRMAPQTISMRAKALVRKDFFIPFF